MKRYKHSGIFQSINRMTFTYVDFESKEGWYLHNAEDWREFHYNSYWFLPQRDVDELQSFKLPIEFLRGV